MPKVHVLVVDDSDDAREILLIILEGSGYRASQACDGYAAIDAVNALKPDVVIMDIFMPRLDGLRATQMIKAQPHFSRLPVIAQTAQPTSIDGSEALFFDVLVKPCEPEKLMACIQRAIKNSERA